MYNAVPVPQRPYPNRRFTSLNHVSVTSVCNTPYHNLPELFDWVYISMCAIRNLHMAWIYDTVTCRRWFEMFISISVPIWMHQLQVSNAPDKLHLVNRVLVFVVCISLHSSVAFIFVLKPYNILIVVCDNHNDHFIITIYIYTIHSRCVG